MKRSQVFVMALLLLVGFSVTACSDGSHSPTASTKEESTLGGTTWVLTSYGKQGAEQPALEGTSVTAVFDEAEGVVNGSAGCNLYFASFTTGGSTLSVSEQVGTTMMYCEGFMEQEQQYLAALGASETYQRQGNQLHVMYSGDQVLNFVAE